MKFNLSQATNNCNLIFSNNNTTVSTIEESLELLHRQTKYSKKCVVISDLNANEQTNKQYFKKLLSLASKKGISQIIGIGLLADKYLYDKTLNINIFNNTDEFLHSQAIHQFKETTILLAGSKEFGFEKIQHILQNKTHQTKLEVNLEALKHNLNYFKSYLKAETKMLVMVKAFSYGSGSYEIANFLEYQNVDYLGVAFTDEGISLRQAGIKLPIIVMNAEKCSYQQVIQYNLEPTIYNINVLNKFNKAVKLAGKSNYPVHIKIDTGMKRLGFDYDNIENLIKALKLNKNLKPISVFTHMAGSPEPEKFNEFSLNQIQKFTKTAEKLQSNYKHKLIRHILNSGGIENYPQAQFEMVRLGIGFYGISAKQNVKLEAISTLKTYISQIRHVSKNETVGYSRNGRLSQDGKIAILPIGYADGLNRKLGNGIGELLINGSLVPIVGNICMDMCMVDITNITVNEGDEAIIFGEKPSISDLADKINTIPYEILTSIAQRVNRIYLTN